MIQELFDHYQIHVNELLPFGRYKSFWVRNKVYILVSVDSFQEEELVEMKMMSDFMVNQGDMTVASFVPTVHGYYVAQIENKNYCLLRSMRLNDRQGIHEGKELAVFHQRGKMFPEPVAELNRIGEWRALWEKRLDQLEKFWHSKVIHHPTDPFEQMFIETFPYYLGLAENAIQYVVDTEMDDEPQLFDAATICQKRFTPDTWKQTKRIKLPTEWVYDHPSRDLAEWVRHMYADKRKDAESTIMQFLYEYESENPLSSFAWRMLFARLVFPLHYFETVEGYYLTGDEERQRDYYDRLEEIVENSSETERFLGNFYRMIRLPVEKLGIRELEWMRM